MKAEAVHEFDYQGTDNSNVISIFHALWRQDGPIHYIAVKTPQGLVFGLIKQFNPSFFEWQIEFGRECLGEEYVGPLVNVRTVIERLISALVSGRGGIWMSQPGTPDVASSS